MKLSPAQIEELRGLLARCADSPMTQQEIARLNELLAADVQAQQMFADYAMLDACLEMVWTGDEDRDEMGDSMLVESPPEEEGIPTLIHASSIFHAPLSAFHSPAGSLLFSYGVAAVVVLVGMLIGWACQVSHLQPDRQEIAGRTTPPVATPSHRDAEKVFVGRITGIIDCRWSNPHEMPVGFDRIVLGRKYALVSGLLEITYDTGAKVLLQGPCTYEVESTTGGYLSFGKLLARVENKRGERGEGNPSPFFSIRTPTAVVADLGTEFGVEVEKSGASMARVYRGRVELRVADADATDARVIPLGENASARVDVKKDSKNKHIITVSRQTSQPDTFVHRIPKRERIKLFSTGVNVKDGKPDPHWQVVARSDEPAFKPHPAIVTGASNAMWLVNQADRSQWISLTAGESFSPDRVVYTFRTTFDLTGMRSSTAILHGRFVVDNHVQAIRLNGRDVRVPWHGSEDFGFFHTFSVVGGFVEGVNVLEIDVKNGAPQEINTTSSPMGLLVELEGSVLAAWPESPLNAIDAEKK